MISPIHHSPARGPDEIILQSYPEKTSYPFSRIVELEEYFEHNNQYSNKRENKIELTENEIELTKIDKKIKKLRIEFKKFNKNEKELNDYLERPLIFLNYLSCNKDNFVNFYSFCEPKQTSLLENCLKKSDQYYKLTKIFLQNIQLVLKYSLIGNQQKSLEDLNEKHEIYCEIQNTAESLSLKLNKTMKDKLNKATEEINELQIELEYEKKIIIDELIQTSINLIAKITQLTNRYFEFLDKITVDKCSDNVIQLFDKLKDFYYFVYVANPTLKQWLSDLENMKTPTEETEKKCLDALIDIMRSKNKVIKKSNLYNHQKCWVDLFFKILDVLEIFFPNSFKSLSLINKAIALLPSKLPKIGIFRLEVINFFIPSVKLTPTAVAKFIFDHFYYQRYKPNEYSLKGYRIFLEKDIAKLRTLTYFMLHYLNQMLLWTNIRLIEGCIQEIETESFDNDPRNKELIKQFQQNIKKCEDWISKLKLEGNELRLADSKLACIDRVEFLADAMSNADLTCWSSGTIDFFENQLNLRLTSENISKKPGEEKSKFQQDLEEFLSKDDFSLLASQSKK